MKKFIIIIFLFVLLTITSLFVFYSWLENWGNIKRTYSDHVVFELKPGQGLDSFTNNLEALKVVPRAEILKAWIKLFSDYKSFQAGQYLVPENCSIDELAQLIIAGKTYNPIVFSITVPEGFTVAKVIEKLNLSNIGSSIENANLINDINFIQSLNIKSNSLEGYLYPATYPFTYLPTTKEVLSLMVNTFWDKLPTGYLEMIQQRGLSLHQAVTFASLIELETANPNEYNQISEVIWNRLNKNMALAIDASIIYGIKDYTGDLKFSHLKDATNLYNTRVHPGLPPGPIGSPSTSALRAVISPTSNGFYYYVLIFGTNSHHFSKNLNEHNSMVRKFLAEQRKAK